MHFFLVSEMDQNHWSYQNCERLQLLSINCQTTIDQQKGSKTKEQTKQERSSNKQ